MRRRRENKDSYEEPITLEEAYAKATSYCAKAERSERSLREKFYSWQVPRAYYDELIERLKEERYLDERRYARAFARDKHRFSSWGRERIKSELLMHRVSSLAIEEALAEVFEEFDEEERLLSLLERKHRQLKPSDPPRKHFDQMMRYGLYRGYSYDQVRPLVERLLRGYDLDEA